MNLAKQYFDGLHKYNLFRVADGLPEMAVPACAIIERHDNTILRLMVSHSIDEFCDFLRELEISTNPSVSGTIWNIDGSCGTIVINPTSGIPEWMFHWQPLIPKELFKP